MQNELGGVEKFWLMGAGCWVLNNFLFPDPKGRKVVWGKLFIVSCYLSFEITTEGAL